MNALISLRRVIPEVARFPRRAAFKNGADLYLSLTNFDRRAPEGDDKPDSAFYIRLKRYREFRKRALRGPLFR